MVENVVPYSEFPPGGIPLDGAYARFGGRLYACRSVSPYIGTAEVTELILISTAEHPGTQWQLSRTYPSCSHTEWTRTIARADADETFAWSSSVVWHGFVPLDELEKLEISREQWPEKPHKPFGRFIRWPVRPKSPWSPNPT
jgi:hypothetical protein